MNNISSQVFVKNTLLPNKVFKKDIHIFLAFEPTLVQDIFFFKCLKIFLKRYAQISVIAKELIGCKEFLMYLEETNYDDWINKVFTIDGLFYTEIGITSESDDWGLYLDPVDFEIGLVGFNNDEQKQLFLDCFGEDQDVFFLLEDYISNMDLMLNFSKETKSKYIQIIKNYASTY